MRFLEVVPMSWRRQERKYVSLKEGEIQDGKEWASIAWPVCVVSDNLKLDGWCDGVMFGEKRRRGGVAV